jgi:hypothetical protein
VSPPAQTPKARRPRNTAAAGSPARTTKSATTKSATTKSATTKSATTKSATTKSATTKSATTKSATTKSATTKSATTKSATTKSATTKSGRQEPTAEFAQAAVVPSEALTVPADAGAAPAEMPRLHVPDEPVDRKRSWLEAIHGGAPISSVLHEADGFDEWLWRRWRSLTAVGVTEEQFVAVVDGYRREIWLWLAGERTWAQCCSGLVGRLGRRAPR